MPKALLWKLGGAALVVCGLKFIFFGGTKDTGSYFELFGFEFGANESKPMGKFECWIVGLALIAVGGYLFTHTVPG